MISNFKQAYPQRPPETLWQTAIWLGLFVSLFLSLFQPFGAYNMEENLAKYLVFIGFGLITLFSVAGLGLIPRKLFPKFYAIKHWTVAKEIFQTIINFIVIGTLNFLFAVWSLNFTFNLDTFLYFEGITVLVGALPFSAIILVRHRRLFKEFNSSAGNLNQQLKKRITKQQIEQDLVLFSDLSKEKLVLKPSDFAFASAADNYVEIHYRKAEEWQKTIMRLSLKKLEDQVSRHAELMRCHRSYMVNLNWVTSFNGNAQGLKLSLREVEEPIPVSRSYVEAIKKELG